jgi:hypothetical protein
LPGGNERCIGQLQSTTAPPKQTGTRSEKMFAMHTDSALSLF